MPDDARDGAAPELERRVRALAREHGLGPAADPIAAAARECALLALGAHAPDAPSGASRYGGAPDLPAGAPWPRRAGDGRALIFLAQVDLAAAPRLAGGALPERGRLYAFVEDATNACRVFYHDAPAAELRRAPTPPWQEWVDWLEIYWHQGADAPDPLKPHLLDVAPGVELPGYGSPLFEEVERLCERPTPAGAPASERFFALADALRADARATGPRATPGADGVGRAVGSLLGCPSYVDGDMREEAHLVTTGRRPLVHDWAWRAAHAAELRLAAAAWHVLWRIESSHHTGASFGDHGGAYLLIPDEDLRRRDFSRVYTAVESG